MSFKVNHEEAIREVVRSRRKVIEDFVKDPYLGYEDLDAAQNDYKFNSQAEVLARLLNGENIFISGPAGSGKTTVINKFIEILDADTQGKANVAVTASTGIAASLIEGQTIHSWSGIGINESPFDRKKISPQMWARRKEIIATDILIIDEISMLAGPLFTKLDAVMKFMRRSKEPFGGVQLIVLGDFLQLPPVNAEIIDKNGRKVPDFACTTDAWKEAKLRNCYMDKTHRASDIKLKYILNRISMDKAKGDENTYSIIKSRLGSEADCDPNKTYTKLFTTNQNVDEYNKKEFEANSLPPKRFKYTASGDHKHVKNLLKRNNIPETLELKIGAKVMLTSNTKFYDGFIPNGSLGVVETFIDGLPRVRFNTGDVYTITQKQYHHKEKITIKLPGGGEFNSEETVATVAQIPLKLGYAITVHKSQGQTFDGIVADLSKCFTPGLGYVALSRVRNLSDLIILDINEKAYQANPYSVRLSSYIKKTSLTSRKNFEENKEHYDTILTSELYRTTIIRSDIMEKAEFDIPL